MIKTKFENACLEVSNMPESEYKRITDIAQ
jgi:hypothetical protein